MQRSIDKPAGLLYFIREASGEPPPSYRAGQHAFNVLADRRPDLAERIRGSEDDPFYLDERLPRFYAAVALAWEDA